MPELGKYAFEVISAYAASLALLALLIAVTLRRGKTAKQALEKAESQVKTHG
ncbi:MAG: heme exporter protein CcmD [Sulfitobacter sp.]